MTGGYNGWKDSDGEWRFVITILPERGESGRMIFGLAPQDDSEAEAMGLTETEFRQLMTERYGQTAAETDKAVQACKDGG